MIYETKKRIVTLPILTWKGLAALCFLVLATAGVESCIAQHQELMATAAQNATITGRNAHCDVRSVSKTGVMQLRCNAPGEQMTANTALAIAYLQHQRPLICTLYRGNEASCELAR